MANQPAMLDVESSQIEAVGHDEASSALLVRFKNHSVYQYQNVGKELFQALLGAESVGKFFHAEIKRHPDRFPFSKLQEAA